MELPNTSNNNLNITTENLIQNPTIQNPTSSNTFIVRNTSSQNPDETIIETNNEIPVPTSLSPWKAQKVKYSVYSLFNFLISIVYFNLALITCLTKKISPYWALYTLTIEEGLSFYRFAALVREDSNDWQKGITKMKLFLRFLFKLITLVALFIWQQQPGLPSLFVYTLPCLYFVVSLLVHLIFQKYETFRDGVVIIWKVVRVVLVFQFALFLEKGSGLSFEHKDYIKIFWVGYVGVTLAIPCYAVFLLCSLIGKLHSFIHRRWAIDESKSFLGFVWLNLTIVSLLGYSFYIVSFFVYFVEGKEESYVPKISDRKKLEERKDDFIRGIQHFANLMSILAMIGYFVRKSILNLFSRPVTLWAATEEEEETVIQGDRTSVVDLTTKNQDLTCDYVYKKGTEFFKVVTMEEICEIIELDSQSSYPSETFNKEQEGVLVGLDRESTEKIELEEFQQRIISLREKPAKSVRSASPRFERIGGLIILEKEEMNLGWVSPKKMPLLANLCISPQLEKIRMESKIEKKNWKEKFGGLVLDIKEMKEEIEENQEYEENVNPKEKKPKKQNLKEFLEEEEDLERKISSSCNLEDENSILTRKNQGMMYSPDSDLLRADEEEISVDSSLLEDLFKKRKEKLEKLMKASPEVKLTSTSIEENLSVLCDSKTCVICLQNESECVFQPCGHGNCCFSCVTRVIESKGTCHFCRADIERILRIDNKLEYEGFYKVKELYKVVAG